MDGFRHIDFSSSGPFDKEQSICFPYGCTVIGGGNGTGKTTIFNTLRRELNNKVAPDWLVFFGEDARMSLPYGGEPWAPLAHILSCHQELFTHQNAFEDVLTKNIRQILEAKIEIEKGSKFSSVVTSSEQLSAKLTIHGAVVISNNEGKNINRSFQATGERIALLLAITSALRKQFSIDLPYVIDGLCGQLDESLGPSCYEFIRRMREQVILLESDNTLEKLGIKPDFQIVMHPITHRSSLFPIGINLCCPKNQDF